VVVGAAAGSLELSTTRESLQQKLETHTKAVAQATKWLKSPGTELDDRECATAAVSLMFSQVRHWVGAWSSVR
jgi:hypothetical protein